MRMRMKCPSQLNRQKVHYFFKKKLVRAGTLYFILHISDNVVINREW